MEKNTAYLDAIQGAAFYLLPNAGFLTIEGDDRVGFLQRQTTNDILLLDSQRVLLTVLTSPTARILDVLYLLNQADVIGAITLPGQAGATARFLKSRIFFMDKVAVKDASDEFVQLEIFGSEAGPALSSVGFDYVPGVDEISLFRIADHDASLFRMQSTFGLGFRLLARSSAMPEILGRFNKSGITELDDQTYHLLRVEAGLPSGGSELTEDYTPLETGLRAAVSSSKGCYTGQEVIARQITYDKVTQRLCGLNLENPVDTGVRLWKDGKATGLVTSTAVSPRFGPIGLAMIRKPQDQPGLSLEIGDADRGFSHGEVVTLPFNQNVSDRTSP